MPKTLVAILFLLSSTIALADDRFNQPSIGVEAIPVDDSMGMIEKTFGKSPAKTGMFFAAVLPSGPAFDSGIKINTIITHINRKLVKTNEQFDEAISRLSIDKEAVFEGYALTDSVWRKATFRVKPKALKNVLLKHVENSDDKLTEQKFLVPRSAPKLAQTCMYLYLSGNKNDGFHLRIKGCYAGKDWIFIDSIKVRVSDGPVETLVENVSIRDKDIVPGGIIERFDVPVKDEMLELLRKMAKYKCQLRFDGRDANFDHQFSYQDGLELQTMLDLYDYVNRKE